MKNKSLLQQAKDIADKFESSGRGSGYVYVFLGQITNVQLHFEEIDGHLYQSDWSFDVDLDDVDSICYVGMGVGNRINSDAFRKITVPTASHRLKIKTGLSRREREELERRLIKFFGRVTSPAERGVLANIKDGDFAPVSYVRSSASFANRSSSNPNIASAVAVRRVLISKPLIVCDENKKLIARGSATELEKVLGVSRFKLSETAREPETRFSISIPGKKGKRFYVCPEEEFKTFQPNTQKSRFKASSLQRFVARNSEGQTLIGTAVELAKIICCQSGNIHRSANPNYPGRHGVKGWLIERLA